MRFVDLDAAQFDGATVLLDIDGTLIPDKSEVLEEAVEQKLKEISAIADVYLSSNGSAERTRRIAEHMGVGFLPKLRKPLSSAAIRALERKPRTIVVGDKYLTDRLLALRIGAEFVQVTRIRAEEDRSRTRAAYVIDDAAAFVAALLSLLRPHQWVKNLLVFAPLFFARAFFVPSLFHAAVVAFVAFSIGASAIYVLNDVLDRVEDSAHPKKRRRPIASGKITVRIGLVVCAALLALEAVCLSIYPSLTYVLLLYLAINALYSVSLKKVPVIDIVCVAACYNLRLMAGSVATHIPLSPWIMLCVFFGALFVVIGKRRAEYARPARRKVLESYTKEALDTMLSLSAGLAIISYALYTVIGREEPYLIYSTLFVVAALLRVLHDIHSSESSAEAPERLFFKDPWIFGSFVGWAVYLFCIFYGIF